MIARYRVLRERLLADWADVRRAADKATYLTERAMGVESDSEVYIEAAALNLHGVYSGLEHVFEWLARELDGSVPSGPTWHRDLLDQMSLDVPSVRPKVVAPETRDALDEYLAFRHRVRSIYSWEFAPAKVLALVDRLPALVDMLETDLTTFAGFLLEAADSDHRRC